jgi:hypothetical protein
MHTPFDDQWFDGLRAAHLPTGKLAGETPDEASAATPRVVAVERAQDWGEAPDTMDFVGRSDELDLLRHWVVEERSRLVAIHGMGGIGKTSVATRLVFVRVHQAALSYA